MTRTELIARRTARSKTFDNGDGTYTLESGGGHAHHRENGAWVDTDCLLAGGNAEVLDAETGEAYTHATGHHPVDFRINKFKQGFKFADRSAGIRFVVKPLNARQSTGVKSLKTIRFPQAWDGIDALYTITPEGVKADYTKTAACGVIAFSVSGTGDFLAYHREPTYTIPTGIEPLPVPWTFDGSTLTYDLAAVPVGAVIDPTLALQPDATAGKDATIRADSTTQNLGASSTLYGGDSSGYRWWLLAQDDLSSIPSAATVISDTWSLYRCIPRSGATSVAFTVHRILREWDEGTGDFTTGDCCWNNAKTGVPWGTAGCENTTSDREAGNWSSKTIDLSAAASWHDFTMDISLTQQIVAGTFTNRGQILRGAGVGEDARLIVYSSDEATNTTLRPKRTVTYTEAAAPTVTTQAATDLAPTTATGNGNVTSDGGATVTERGVCWGASANPTTGDSKAAAAGTTGAYTASMTPLTESAHYHYRAYATNSAGTSYGADTEFDTAAASHTITFESNGGSTVTAITQADGSAVTAPTAPTKTGSTFTGWYSDAGLTTPYTFTTMPASNITLYAKWTVIVVEEPPVMDWTLARAGAFRFVRVDHATRQELERLTTIRPGGTITRNLNVTLKESGSLPVIGPLDLGDDLVRIYYDVIDDDGTQLSIALATMHAAAESVRYTSATSASTLTLYSALLGLQASLQASLTLTAGTVAVDAAAALCAALGLPVVASPSTRVLGADASWNAGATYLEVVNYLLDVAGFWSASVDGWGRVVLAPYHDPSERASAWRFESGARCVFLPDVEVASDAFFVPNVCILTASRPDAEAIVGTYTNDDPASPYSTVSRSREIPLTGTVDDAVDEADLIARAKARLIAATSATETVKVKHAYVPIAPGDAADLVWAGHALDMRGAAVSQDITLSAAATVITTFKRIWR